MSFVPTYLRHIKAFQNFSSATYQRKTHPEDNKTDSSNKKKPKKPDLFSLQSHPYSHVPTSGSGSSSEHQEQVDPQHSQLDSLKAAGGLDDTEGWSAVDYSGLLYSIILYSSQPFITLLSSLLSSVLVYCQSFRLRWDETALKPLW